MVRNWTQNVEMFVYDTNLSSRPRNSASPETCSAAARLLAASRWSFPYHHSSVRCWPLPRWDVAGDSDQESPWPVRYGWRTAPSESCGEVGGSSPSPRSDSSFQWCTDWEKRTMMTSSLERTRRLYHNVNFSRAYQHSLSEIKLDLSHAFTKLPCFRQSFIRKLNPLPTRDLHRQFCRTGEERSYIKLTFWYCRRLNQRNWFNRKCLYGMP